MNTKHTPGPWTCNPSLRTNSGRWDVMSRGLMVANVGGLGKPDREANARLIAAAPDLLAALEKFLDARSGRHGHTTMPIAEAAARAAVAKAGQS